MMMEEHHGSSSGNNREEPTKEIRYVLFIKFDSNDFGSKTCYGVAKHLKAYVEIVDILDLIETHTVPPFLKGCPTLVDRESAFSEYNPLVGQNVYKFLIKMKSSLDTIIQSQTEFTSLCGSNDNQTMMMYCSPEEEDRGNKNGGGDDLTYLRQKQKMYSDNRKLNEGDLAKKIDNYLSFHNKFSNDTPETSKRMQQQQQQQWW